MSEDAAEALGRLGDVVRSSGLVKPGSRGLALLSGGADSACLAAGLTRFVGAETVTGLHVNYGIRSDSGEDQGAAERLAEMLGIELEVFHVGFDLESANLQEAARDARYEIAEDQRARRGADWIATGHTRTDLAETVLYRLASSPGRRALLGLPPRRGFIVRPLLALGRDDTRRIAREAGLPYYDDPSNRMVDFARVRLREQALPTLRKINPAAEQNIAATWAELAEEAAALEALADEALLQAGAPPGATSLLAERLEDLHPAIRRLALRRLAERAAGRSVALGPERAEQIWRLAGRPEGGQVEIGGGLLAVCEAGMIRFSLAPGAEPEPAELQVPGQCRFGRWELRAELRPAPVEPVGPDIATLDAGSVGTLLEVRAWRDGDRMRPLGLGGTKTLQDLFTDNRVPRSLRHTLPVVASDDRIAWVAGVAVSDEFKLGPDSDKAAVLTASLVD